MSDIILHHFDASPFAEKIRLALGLKGLSWRSVEIPMVMPKPDLTALTGGYRKTPVMQIGADIYCDTQRIAAELERRFPEPTLFPGDSAALSTALSHWSDAAFFQPGAGLSMGTNAGLPENVLADRRAFFNFLDFSTLDQQLPHLFSQFRGHLQLVEGMLADGRPFVLGERCGWADILAYFPLWMGRGNVARTGELVQTLPALQAWEARMQAVGHGSPAPMDAATALSIARDTAPVATGEIAPDAWPAIPAGSAVTVTPHDYGAVPVAGTLLRLTHADIAIRREDPRAGELVVHFPRLGYELEVSQ
ncbi:MAG: glutathione S-transferase family protein [Halioglobus sp.]